MISVEAGGTILKLVVVEVRYNAGLNWGRK